MVNIFITSKCNLKCTYCFAKDIIKNSDSEISIENFKKALYFITKNNNCSKIGLIGGEPTLHNKFDYILDYIKKNSSISKTVVYTNGIQLDNYFDILLDTKFKILINCNAEEKIGRNNYNKLLNNIDFLMFNNSDKVMLGINIYEENQDISNIIELLKKYKQKYIRISLSVNAINSKESIISYQKRFKSTLLKIIDKIYSINVYPYFDCNQLLPCIQDEDYKKKYVFTNISSQENRCMPIIDILPNLDVIRCFGLSDLNKVNISEFECVDDVINYFLNKIDMYAYQIPSDFNCRECYKRKTLNCVGGCISYKKEAITKLQSIISKEFYHN